MSNYELFAAVLTFVALLGIVNHKTVKLPTTIALMSGALLVSLILVCVDQLTHNQWEVYAQKLLVQIDFKTFLLDGILNLLLFAGAINVDISQLVRAKNEISVLALGATIVSTVLIACTAHYLAPKFSLDLPWLYSFLLGAVISPTDPIAVLAIFKELNAPELLDTTVSGESLFNDGVAIVIFTTLLTLTTGQAEFSVAKTGVLFLELAIGGIVYGCILGFIGYRLIARVDDHKLQILVTLSMATGGYYFAHAIGVSGPLAMVCAGIFIGNQGRQLAMTRDAVELLDSFWEMVDEVLNAILFFLIGAELLILPYQETVLKLGLIMIPCFIVIRALTVYVPLRLMQRKRHYPRFFKSIVIWGGLRGGLAVALALSLPSNHYRDVILLITYCMVVFSILIQGTTVKWLVRRAA